MSELTDLLGQYETMLTGLGSPAPGWLAPGVEPDVVREAVGRVALDPPQDLIDWYGWHNGFRLESPSTRDAREITPANYALDLERAVDNHIKWVDPTRENPEVSGYFPILCSLSGELTAMDCLDHSPGHQARVVHFTDGMLPPLNLRVPGLATAVRWWVDAVETGIWWYVAGEGVYGRGNPMEDYRFATGLL